MLLPLLLNIADMLAAPAFTIRPLLPSPVADDLLGGTAPVADTLLNGATPVADERPQFAQEQVT